jgi:hypothetical protein
MQDILDHPFLKHNYKLDNELNLLEKNAMDSIFQSGKKKRRSYCPRGIGSDEFLESDFSTYSNELKFSCGITSRRSDRISKVCFSDTVRLQILNLWVAND